MIGELIIDNIGQAWFPFTTLEQLRCLAMWV